jgi:hypothetical protein
MYFYISSLLALVLLTTVLQVTSIINHKNIFKWIFSPKLHWV